MGGGRDWSQCGPRWGMDLLFPFPAILNFFQSLECSVVLTWSLQKHIFFSLERTSSTIFPVKFLFNLLVVSIALILDSPEFLHCTLSSIRSEIRASWLSDTSIVLSTMPGIQQIFNNYLLNNKINIIWLKRPNLEKKKLGAKERKKLTQHNRAQAKINMVQPRAF
jgi:hypothetical protein